MDETKSSAGGPTMGMENSNPGIVQNGQMASQQPANQPTDFYTQQPQHAAQDSNGNAQPQPAQAADNNNNVAANTTSPVTADDSDLIEKEWVQKAESIVEKTRRDPFVQSQELNRLKTEYLHKRYGKNVGTGGH